MRKFPWLLIIAGGALVAALVGYALYQNDAGSPQRIQAAEQPVSYDLAQLHPQVREAVHRARDAESRANAAAAQARDAAEKARATGVQSPVSGLGFESWSGDSAGDRYAGYYDRSVRNGVGVLHWVQDARNRGSSLRYEGEWLDDKAHGVGLMYFRDGSRHAGSERDDLKSGPGVIFLDGGFRYEGEFARDKYNGYGVMWRPQGRAYEAGMWTDNKLTTPLGNQRP